MAEDLIFRTYDTPENREYNDAVMLGFIARHYVFGDVPGDHREALRGLLLMLQDAELIIVTDPATREIELVGMPYAETKKDP